MLVERAAGDQQGDTLAQTSGHNNEAYRQTLTSKILTAHLNNASGDYFGNSSTFTFVPVNGEDGSGDKSDQEKSTSEQWQYSSITDGSTTDHDSPPAVMELESLFSLPERTLADNLVDAYFDRTHRLYPFLHEGTFRTEYEAVWEKPSSRRYSRLAWFGLLNIVLAHGAEVCDTLPGVPIHASTAQFVSRARRIILFHVFRSSTLETVQSLLLMCYHLQSTVDLNECWALVGLMIRTAMSLGLHLPPLSPAFNAVTKEVRKRIWWGCFVIDQTISMKFGRPPTLRTADIMVELPREVDDQYISANSVFPRQPIGTPSSTALFIFTIKLGQIIHSMLNKVYNGGLSVNENQRHSSVRGPTSTLTNAVVLDSELQSLWDDAPPHLTQDTEGASGRVEFQRQRLVMRIRYQSR